MKRFVFNVLLWMVTKRFVVGECSFDVKFVTTGLEHMEENKLEVSCILERTHSNKGCDYVLIGLIMQTKTQVDWETLAQICRSSEVDVRNTDVTKAEDVISYNGSLSESRLTLAWHNHSHETHIKLKCVAVLACSDGTGKSRVSSAVISIGGQSGVNFTDVLDQDTDIEEMSDTNAQLCGSVGNDVAKTPDLSLAISRNVSLSDSPMVNDTDAVSSKNFSSYSEEEQYNDGMFSTNLSANNVEKQGENSIGEKLVTIVNEFSSSTDFLKRLFDLEVQKLNRSLHSLYQHENRQIFQDVQWTLKLIVDTVSRLKYQISKDTIEIKAIIHNRILTRVEELQEIVENKLMRIEEKFKDQNTHSSELITELTLSFNKLKEQVSKEMYSLNDTMYDGRNKIENLEKFITIQSDANEAQIKRFDEKIETINKTAQEMSELMNLRIKIFYESLSTSLSKQSQDFHNMNFTLSQVVITFEMLEESFKTFSQKIHSCFSRIDTVNINLLEIKNQGKYINDTLRRLEDKVQIQDNRIQDIDTAHIHTVGEINTELKNIETTLNESAKGIKIDMNVIQNKITENDENDKEVRDITLGNRKGLLEVNTTLLQIISKVKAVDVTLKRLEDNDVSQEKIVNGLELNQRQMISEVKDIKSSVNQSVNGINRDISDFQNQLDLNSKFDQDTRNMSSINKKGLIDLLKIFSETSESVNKSLKFLDEKRLCMEGTIKRLQSIIANQSNEIRDKASNEWPGGNFALLKPSTGCPVSKTQTWQWEEGAREFHTETTSNQDSHSVNLHMELPVKSRVNGLNFMTIRYCVRNDKTSSRIWPKGSYCIHKMGDCPVDFSSGHLSVDEEDFNFSGRAIGAVIKYSPYGYFSFCCRSDGDLNTPIALPRFSPFYLYRHGGRCQEVHGMISTEEYLYMDTENNSNLDSSYIPVPDSRINNINVTLCYYEPLLCY